RPERAVAAAPVPCGGQRDRPGGHQARRHRQGRGGVRAGARVRYSDPLCRHWRASGRPARVRRRSLRRRAAARNARVSAIPRQPGPPQARRRWRRILLLLCAVALALLALLSLVVWIALPPERIVPMVLARVGASMGLEISARGDAATRLGRQPSFVVRDLVVREPGAARPLLRARRLLVSLPWRTIRGLGNPLELARVELDAPVLDVAALQHWLATRPPGDGRLPTLTRGIQVRDGRVEGGSWRIDALALGLPQLRHDSPVRARASGRYVDSTIRAPFNVAATLQRPASGRGFAA